MPNWKKLIVSGSDASLNSLNATAALTASGLIYPSSDGFSGQVISTDGNGKLSFSTVSGGGTALTISGSSAGGTQVSSNSFTKLQFDSDTGLNLDSIDSGATALISIGSHYRDIIVDGQTTLVATGSDQLELIGGTGIDITTSITDTNSNSVSKELAFAVDSTIATTGSNTFVGDQIITGSITGTEVLTIASTLTAGGATIANINYPTTDGDEGDFLTTDGAGNLSFGRPNVYANVKNISGGTLQKGTPVHATGTAGNTSEVIAASASVASTMPATYVLNETLADDAEGLALVVGYINGIDTSAFEEGDVVYVGENGGFTNVKPQGSDNLIQNLGLVNKVHASNGSGYVYGSGRSNDVPNLPTGKIWVGSDTYTVTSSLIDLDETGGSINLNGDITASANMSITGDLVVAGTGSFNYIESVTGSAKIIGDAYIILNNNTPAERYAGLVVQDSGSAGVTASLEFDGESNDWFYEYSDDGGSSTEHGVVIFGPEYQTKGTPIYNTNNTIVKGNGGHHIEDSNITDDGNTITLDSTLYVTQSKVGIGTTSPGHKLQVDGGVYATNYLSVSGVNTNFNFYNNGTTYLNGDTTVDSTFLVTNGNVGIGTSSPSTKLHVSSSSYNDHLTLGRDTDELGISVSGGQIMIEGGLSPFNNDSEDLGRSDKHWQDLYITDNIYVSQSAVLTLNGGLEATGDLSGSDVHIDDWGSVSGSLASIQATAAAAETDTLATVTGRGNTTTTSIGIGASTPSSTEALLIHKDDTNGQFVTHRNNTGFFLNRTYADYNNDGAIVEYQERVGVDGNYTRIGNFSNHPFYLMANNDTKVSILTNGNVGIGTTLPQEKLHVYGGVGLINVSDNWQQSSSKTSLIRGGNFQTTISNETNALKIYPVGDDRAIGDYWGGIEFLHLDPDSNNWGGSYTGGNFWIGGRVIDQPGQERSAFVIATNDATTAGTHPTEKMVVMPNGNVGIGTTSPGHKLDVNGNIRGNNLYLNDSTVPSLYMERGDGLPQPVIRLVKSNDNLLIGHTAIDEVIFYDDAGEAMRLDGSGNLGIGTTSPVERLEVHSANAKITANSTADGQTVGFEAKYLNNPTLKGTFHYTTGDARLWIDNHFTGNNGNYSDIIFRNKNVGGDQLLKERLIIKGSTGNVGIGTTSPSAKLDVEGDIQIESANISYQENTDVDSAAAETIATVNTGSFTGAFFDYTCVSGSNARVGTVMAVNLAGSVEFTDNSTKDIGDTSPVTLSVDISGADMRLRATTTTDNWSIKSLVRTL